MSQGSSSYLLGVESRACHSKRGDGGERSTRGVNTPSKSDTSQIQRKAKTFRPDFAFYSIPCDSRMTLFML